jgi:hypothetical protein
MKIQQIINNKEYLDRLDSVRSVGAGNNNDSSGYNIEHGSIAAFFETIGLKQLPDDLAPIIDAFFASTFAKTMSAGLHSLPSTAHVGGGLKDLALIKPVDLANLAVIPYTVISGPINGKRRH